MHLKGLDVKGEEPFYSPAFISKRKSKDSTKKDKNEMSNENLRTFLP